MEVNVNPVRTDLGHQGDFDFTQIEALLRMTPEQRLDHHEGWRLFVREAIDHARIRSFGDSTK